MAVTKLKDISQQVYKDLAFLATQKVMVGITAATAPRKDEEGKKSVVNNAMLGFINEFGSPAKNIPARPFLSPGVLLIKDDILRYLKHASCEALDGKTEEVTNDLNAIGLLAQASVKKKIVSGPFEALAPATIKARKRRGFTSEKPLIETGSLVGSITYAVDNGNNKGE
jgi:phage gpG-like protein